MSGLHISDLVQYKNGGCYNEYFQKINDSSYIHKLSMKATVFPNHYTHTLLYGNFN